MVHTSSLITLQRVRICLSLTVAAPSPSVSHVSVLFSFIDSFVHPFVHPPIDPLIQYLTCVGGQRAKGDSTHLLSSQAAAGSARRL